MTHGVRLTLAYDGTEFAGYQRQPEARTIQRELEAAIAVIAQHPVVVRAAGRTDAGVHAEAQIVAFDTTRDLSPRRWLLALNRYLPEDAAVRDVCACEPGYHPRFDALDKTYRYLFHLGLGRDPLLRHRAWQLSRSGARPSGPTDLVSLDMNAIREASASMIGTHHFGAFRATDDRRENTQRTLHRVDWIANWNGHAELLALEVQGSAFMKNMVRIIAGTLVAVGRGRMTPARVGALLEPNAVRDRQSETAPAHGLTLVRVRLGRLRAE
ncbi:MAG TPA: tRNA pseudouridine(38-40) synthase TruA [Polyangiales bacterium]|nr:tRNA pseudouridine(38-40) synthase TruA [Polyangiales bacterium]